MNPLLTAEDAGLLLRVSPRSIILAMRGKLNRAPKLQGFRYCRRYYTTRRNLAKFVENHYSDLLHAEGRKGEHAGKGTRSQTND
jgi:hypothetical protein